jgi:urease accessory protein
VFTDSSRQSIFSRIALIAGFTLLIATQPAYAHHAMGSQLPTNFLQGFLSGLAHPVIGLDHLAFVVAIGMVSAAFVQAAWIPAAFVVAAMAGTGIHVLGLELPLAEFAIALSVIALGVILFLNRQLQFAVVVTIAATAGVFHGYAYGEAIAGSEMTPLLAYLAGFTLIQYAIATAALKLTQTLPKASFKRWAGFGVTLIGVAFLATAIAG